MAYSIIPKAVANCECNRCRKRQQMSVNSLEAIFKGFQLYRLYFVCIRKSFAEIAKAYLEVIAVGIFHSNSDCSIIASEAVGHLYLFKSTHV